MYASHERGSLGGMDENDEGITGREDEEITGGKWTRRAKKGSR